MIYNPYGRTNVIVRLWLCVIAHRVMKAYGKADFKLRTLLNPIEDRQEWWNSRLGRFFLLQWADSNYWIGAGCIAEPISLLGGSQILLFSGRFNASSSHCTDWATRLAQKHQRLYSTQCLSRSLLRYTCCWQYYTFSEFYYAKDLRAWIAQCSD